MWTFCWKTSGGWITLWIPWLETPPAVDCIAFTFCNWSWTPRLSPPREEPHVTTLPSLRIAANASFVAWTSCTSVSLWMVGWVCTRCSCLGWGHDAKNSVRNWWAHNEHWKNICQNCPGLIYQPFVLTRTHLLVTKTHQIHHSSPFLFAQLGCVAIGMLLGCWLLSLVVSAHKKDFQDLLDWSLFFGYVIWRHFCVCSF